MKGKGWLHFSIGISNLPGEKVPYRDLMDRLEALLKDLAGMNVRSLHFVGERSYSTVTFAATFPGKQPPHDSEIIKAMHERNPRWSVRGRDCWYIGSKWIGQP